LPDALYDFFANYEFFSANTDPPGRRRARQDLGRGPPYDFIFGHPLPWIRLYFALYELFLDEQLHPPTIRLPRSTVTPFRKIASLVSIAVAIQRVALASIPAVRRYATRQRKSPVHYCAGLEADLCGIRGDRGDYRV